jgi:uncharacterized protein (DUF924 family)
MTERDTEHIEEILDYWLGGDIQQKSRMWFTRDEAVDADIRARFGALYQRAAAGEFDYWADMPRGRLALIILLDQFSRNLHRDSPAAFASDRKAQELCVEGIDRGDDRQLSALERWFFYMPLQHAEDLDLQERSVRAFEDLAADAAPEHATLVQGGLDYARRHRDVIARFGRFPHRNEVLGRDSTAEEREHLAEHGGF